MVEQSGSPSTSSSPPPEILSEEPFPELLQSLEHQGVELGVIMSIETLSSRPPPLSDIGSLFDIGPKSLDNPIQTTES